MNKSAPIPQTLVELAPHLYRLCASNPSAMTGPGTNTYLYGRSELAVFDAGPNLKSHIDDILAAQSQLNAPITRLFSSHTHSDHSPAVAELVKALPEVEVIGLPAPAGQDYEDHTFQATLEPVDYQWFAHEGRRVQAIHTPGHVANHVCFYIEEYQFLTTGDHLMQGSTVVIIPPKGHMGDYIASLRKLEPLDIAVMGPGHGALIDNPKETVRWTIEHRLQREAKVVDALRAAAPIKLSQLVTLVYDDVNPALHGIAQLSLHAHLIKLQEDGVASEKEGRWLLSH